MNKELHNKALAILRSAFDENADFYPGQYEAIEATLTNKRTIVVQKTGWGKSLVYFISAKMTEGVTIIISPLLVLIDNQKKLAERFGLNCGVLNSTVQDESRAAFFNDARSGRLDVIFTTPETLYKPEMQQIIPSLHIGLFVVDECHCISEWGHDFRLQYGKLYRVINNLPENVPVLGTTATANDRVIADLKKQFGKNVYVSRGSLTRDSLHIEILNLATRAERYAWMKENIMRLPGSGIVYAMTHNDCDYIADFLNQNGISARAYYSSDELPNKETEELFYNNEIKVIVATVKLGMGYDKKDIGFIIHFQKPSSVVAYYQQIGRAGRQPGSEAYCYLMTGVEDDTISKYFIENAFPTEEEEREIIRVLESEDSGVRYSELERACNISKGTLDRTLNMLENNGMIYKENSLYYRSANEYDYPSERYESVKKIKYHELDEMNEYISTDRCYSRFIVNSLNDDTATDCGKCANCLKHGILEGVTAATMDEVKAIQEKLGSIYIDIEPRKMWKDRDNNLDRSCHIKVKNETGLALAKYGEAGYGEMVAHDKYHADAFRDELVDKAASVLAEKLSDQGYTAITSVPSNRNQKVREFAVRVAQKMGLEYIDALKKKEGHTAQQKEMQNSYYQYRNVIESMETIEGVTVPENVILIDDMVDSGWTLTVCGRMLTTIGAVKVFPFCLADSSRRGGDE